MGRRRSRRRRAASSRRPRGVVERVAVLGAEPWGRADVVLDAPYPAAAARGALAAGDVARAAYLAGAADALLAAAADHARTRTQFGRAIGEFQAVAHPLA